MNAKLTKNLKHVELETHKIDKKVWERGYRSIWMRDPRDRR